MQEKCTTGRVRNQQKMSPIEARMVDDMTKRGYSPLTQKIYLRAVRHLSEHYANRSPELISLTEAQCYLRLMKKRGFSISTAASYMGGIRFLFEVTFGKAWQPVSPLRQRMLEDMDLRGFSVRTQDSYVRSVAALARCRTHEAGGQLWHCPKCGQTHTACHSCGNRHCPTCGGDDARLYLFSHPKKNFQKFRQDYRMICFDPVNPSVL